MPAPVWQGLGQAERRRQQQRRAADGKDDEDAPPRSRPQQLAPEQGGQDRRRAVDQDRQGEEPRRLDSRVEVAHDRPRDHDPGRPGEALGEADGDQRFDRWRDRAEERGCRVPGQADRQRAAPSPGVAQRPRRQLAERQPEQAGAQRQLRLRRAGLQIPPQRRQPRQVHVERERPECARRPEQHDQLRAFRPDRRRLASGPCAERPRHSPDIAAPHPTSPCCGEPPCPP